MIKKFQEYPFWKITVLSAILFFIIVVIIELLISLVRNEALTDITTKFFSQEFLIPKTVGAIIYGLIIAFFYRRKAKKIQKNLDKKG